MRDGEWGKKEQGQEEEDGQLSRAGTFLTTKSRDDLLRDILQAIASQNAQNWQAVQAEIIEILREEVPTPAVISAKQHKPSCVCRPISSPTCKPASSELDRRRAKHRMCY